VVAHRADEQGDAAGVRVAHRGEDLVEAQGGVADVDQADRAHGTPP
jgi:hypothetical protein